MTTQLTPVVNNFSLNILTGEATYTETVQTDGVSKTVLCTTKVEALEGYLKRLAKEFLSTAITKEPFTEAQILESSELLNEGHLATCCKVLHSYTVINKSLRRKDAKNPFNPTGNEKKVVKFYRVNPDSVSVSVIEEGQSFRKYAYYSYAKRNKSAEPLAFLFTSKEEDSQVFEKAHKICFPTIKNPALKDGEQPTEAIPEKIKPVEIELEEFLLFYEHLVATFGAETVLEAKKSKHGNERSFFATKAKVAQLERHIVGFAKTTIAKQSKFEREFKRSIEKGKKAAAAESISKPHISEGVKIAHN